MEAEMGSRPDDDDDEDVFSVLGKEVVKKVVRWVKNPLNAVTDIADALTGQGCTNYDEDD